MLNQPKSDVVVQALTSKRIEDGEKNFKPYFRLLIVLSVVLQNMIGVACSLRIPHATLQPGY